MRKVFGAVLFSLLLSGTFLLSKASAALTLGSTSVASSGPITLTGVGASVWDLGSGNALSLQTVGNGPITTGTGLLNLGGSLGFNTGTIIIGDTTGNTRGSYATDVQAKHDATQVASGTYSATLGSFDTASATYSVALGTMNSSTNTYTSTLGNQNTASAAEATAIGTFNTASAFNATAIGQSITNSTANSVMIGPSDSSKVTILSSGFVGASNASPQSTLQVGTTNSTSNQYLQIDSESGAPSAGDCNADTQRGRMIHDYTNFKIYVCGGASRGWDHLDLVD